MTSSTPSIDDVAAAAGVHRSTVSRTFSRPDAVKQSTREHVLRVAEELGYKMSPLAQALRTKSSNLVPLLVPDITNPYFAELAKAMTAAADESGYQLVLCVTGDDPAAESRYLEAMQSMYAPFAIIAPYSHEYPDDARIAGFGRRGVIIDRGEGGDGVSTVSLDNARGIALALEHLYELGHTEIAYVSGLAGTRTAADRRQAYLALSEQRGLGPRELTATDPGADLGESVADQIRTIQNPPTALIAGNDLVAFRLISALGTRGIRVPDDISVTGFDGLPLGASFNPPLTSVRQPIAEMGAAALAIAQRVAEGAPVEHVVLEPDLLIRSSTRRIS
ncbi:LacI family DNA-binding transcriptional regulator [Actinomyces sp.]|uniref:LacI family DNA-binding transcriptional regulator n=1 Tax=Actinomyces sp. TaxID=29317 RepID=UPI0026DB2E6A|nr:substrate-binding domain-containing protein [Actinomyces sp.]MDO4901499.1 substrate-binding domain-containing protein [Actinomyces sp.]